MVDFESHRPLLLGIAYRMLGDRAEAEDVVQEAYLRQNAAPAVEVESPRAYLSTVVTRLCLDRLKSARARRESYVGPWLPEPLPTDASVDRESVSMAFLVVLESLSPVERAVFLLHEVFDYGHAEVAAIVGKEEAAVRQIFHRAKQHVLARRPRFSGSKESNQRLLGAFVQACATGDLDGLKQILAADAVAYNDGGGKVSAATRPVHGADNVARFFVGLSKKGGAGLAYEMAELNGDTAIVARQNGAVHSAILLATDGEHVTQIHVIRNPEKLARL